VPDGRLESRFADPRFRLEQGCVALERDEIVGFGFGVVLEGGDGRPWSYVPIAVRSDHRRRGLGTSLLSSVTRAQRMAADEHRPIDQIVGAFVPAPGAEAFAAKHGFRFSRTFWRMSRSPARALPVAWPEGVSTRPYDGSPEFARDWNDAYNDSFREHYRYVRSTFEEALALTRAPEFDPRDVLVAYRNGRLAGFCRNESVGDTGVVGTIGVVRAARGIGLGRALLRWAIGSISDRGFAHVALMVDGANETALRLYRSEGFEVARTRTLWERPLP
jgi:mycothiol synthase